MSQKRCSINILYIINLYIAMYVLRESKRVTQALVLYEMLRWRRATLKEIGEKLGMSAQAVANYLAELEDMGFVDKFQGSLTHQGVEFLHETMGILHKEINAIVSNLNMVLSTEAIADVPVKAGQQVSLYMKNGVLHAGNAEASAKGIAVGEAQPGEIVEIKEMKGVVEIKRGKILIFVLDKEREKELPEADVFAGYGLRAQHFLEKRGKKDFIRFSVPEACVECALLGQNVVCVLSPDLLYVFLKAMHEAMQKHGNLEYEIVSRAEK